MFRIKAMIFLGLLSLFITGCSPYILRFNVPAEKNEKAWGRANIFVYTHKEFGEYNFQNSNDYIINSQYMSITREPSGDNYEYVLSMIYFGNSFEHGLLSPLISNGRNKNKAFDTILSIKEYILKDEE